MNRPSRTRRGLLAAFAAGTLALGGCAGPAISDFEGQRPALDLREYFNGPLVAHGVFTDRSGKVVKRFRVDMVGTWNGDTGVLDEDFTYADGTKERRVWTLKRSADGRRYTGTAGDVIGEAQGEVAGNALRWRYVLKVPVDGSPWTFDFDDWMYLMDDQVMLNRATMSKWGIKVGEVTLSFHKPR